MADADIQAQIHSAFLAIYNNPQDEDSEARRFRLRFSIANKSFLTTIHVKCFQMARDFKIFSLAIKGGEAGCLGIDIGFHYGNPKDNRPTLVHVDSGIFGNSVEKQCFTPVLTSSPRNANIALRYTSTDVLQILKMKLNYLIPNTNLSPINIRDLAVINNVSKTDFSILRGERPLYQKYGFEYKGLPELSRFLETVTWGEIKDMRYPFPEGTVDKTFAQIFQEITGNEYPSEMPIQVVMRNVSFEQESAFNLASAQAYNLQGLRFSIPSHGYFLSRNVLKAIHTLARKPREIGVSVSEAQHNPRSDDWTLSSNRLLFTEFTPLGEGGKRRTSKSSTHRKYKKTTRRLKKALKA